MEQPTNGLPWMFGEEGNSGNGPGVAIIDLLSVDEAAIDPR
jgi:hypothetical protein